jgi:signal transduction histidine kinase
VPTARWAAWVLAAGTVMTRLATGEDAPGEPWLLLITLAQTVVMTGYPTGAGSWVRSGVRSVIPDGADDFLVIGLTDLLLALVIVSLSGGWGSPYYVFAVTALIIPASVVGIRGLLMITALFLGGYALSLAAHSDGLREPWQDGDATSFVAFLAVPVPVSVLVYLLSSTSRRLAAEEARTRDLLEENLQLQEARERLAVERERARIAREVHDGIAQSIYMLSLNLEASTEVAGPGSALGRKLADLVRLAKETLLEVRQYIFDLRPLLAREETVSSAIRTQAEEFSTISGIPVSVDVVGAETDLPISHSAALYRIAQEALANVYRHAHASGVAVRLAFDTDAVRLEVEDDGVGFEEGSREGRGLRHMAERVYDLGGSVSVEAAPARGAVVSAVLPLNGHNVDSSSHR